MAMETNSPSGSDPTIDDDLAAAEKELRKMTREPKSGPIGPDASEDEVDNPENLQAQAIDPAAQES